MVFVDANMVNDLALRVGESIELKSPTKTVLPPYPLIEAFLEAPEWLTVEREAPLDYDGAYGATFRLRATEPGVGSLVVGLRDVNTRQVTETRRIAIRTQ